VCSTSPDHERLDRDLVVHALNERFAELVRTSHSRVSGTHTPGSSRDPHQLLRVLETELECESHVDDDQVLIVHETGSYVPRCCGHVHATDASEYGADWSRPS
jgi:hypothetical protein